MFMYSYTGRSKISNHYPWDTLYRGPRLLRTTLNAYIKVIRTELAEPAWPTRYTQPRLIRTMISIPDENALTNVSVLSGHLCIYVNSLPIHLQGVSRFVGILKANFWTSVLHIDIYATALAQLFQYVLFTSMHSPYLLKSQLLYFMCVFYIDRQRPNRQSCIYGTVDICFFARRWIICSRWDFFLEPQKNLRSRRSS